jgi:hypothetical protein
MRCGPGDSLEPARALRSTLGMMAVWRTLDSE